MSWARKPMRVFRERKKENGFFFMRVNDEDGCVVVVVMRTEK